MNVELIDHMGSDLSVVNAARVSFAKESSWEDNLDKMKLGTDENGTYLEDTLRKRDAKLIRYLARHNHWTPFGHTAVTLHVKAPIFVARQLAKHQVGLVWNEVSRRYVDDPPEYFRPKEYRGKPENAKQGSSEKIIKSVEGLDIDNIVDFTRDVCDNLYLDLLGAGVCPEQARMVLPQSMYTEWYWTGNIAAFARVCNLRLDPHTQKETQDIAQQISDILGPLFPVSWEALIDE